MRVIAAGLSFAVLATAVTSCRARAQNFLNQEWLLDLSLSTVDMQTVKANAIFETHRITVVEESVSSGVLHRAHCFPLWSAPIPHA
jgi:hypothetical protein